MTTRWQVDCWNCSGEGDIEGDCTCMEDTCVCLNPTPPRCSVCAGKGSFVVTQLSDDNYDTAVPID